MARGSIQKLETEDGRRYKVIVDLGIDPVTGKRRQGTKRFNTKAEAQKGLTAWLADIDKGTAVNKSRMTVAELLRYWLETDATHNVRLGTLHGYEYTITHYIIPELGAMPVQSLTPATVQQFYSNQLAAGIGPRTVQLCHLRLTQALKMAVRMGLVARNVAEYTKPPRVVSKEMHVWTKEQAQQFLAAARQSVYGPIWLLSLATGMRKGELLGLRWQDVDFTANTVAVVQTVGLLRGATVIGTPKSKSSRRTITVQVPVMTALREHRARQNEHRLSLGTEWNDHDLVFSAANGKPINPNNLTRDYDRWVKVSGVPRIRVHDQRHTSVSIALQMGANIKAVSQRVGHAKTSITMDIYAHTIAEQHQEVADKLDAALFVTSA